MDTMCVHQFVGRMMAHEILPMQMELYFKILRHPKWS
jgi:hypothetical protein